MGSETIVFAHEKLKNLKITRKERKFKKKVFNYSKKVDKSWYFYRTAIFLRLSLIHILNENEEIIEYLIYDRLSENEKCELYVLYRSKKNTDGSWYISEAEILDIFAYSMSTNCLLYTSRCV